MARRMTYEQEVKLAWINAGWPEDCLKAENLPEDREPLRLYTHNHVVDPEFVTCHRTVRTATPAGSQVQGFRIRRDGTHERFI